MKTKRIISLVIGMMLVFVFIISISGFAQTYKRYDKKNIQDLNETVDTHETVIEVDGQIVLKGTFNAGQILKFRVNGQSNVRISGRDVDKLDIEIDGQSTLDLWDLKANSIRLICNGQSIIYADISRYDEVNCDGQCKIHLKNPPQAYSSSVHLNGGCSIDKEAPVR